MPLQHLSNHFFAQCFLVTLLVTLLSTSSDACGKPPRFENMQLNGSPKTTYVAGEKVQYSCRPGYMRRPTIKIYSVCAANGQWLPISKDACYKKSCPRLDDPNNGQVNFVNGSSEFGTQIQYICNPGFFLIGEEILYCLATGSDVQWSDEPPICSKILCAPPPNIINGVFSPSHKDVFEYHEVATYQCKQVPGQDELSLVGERQIYCSENRLWSANPPECKVVKCPHPVIKNGRLTSGFRKKYSYRAMVMFDCNQGLFLHGSNTVMCEGDSTWQPPIPTCKSKPPPPPPTTSVPSSTGTALDFGDSKGWSISLIMMAMLEL
ncbi:membrane cofactor protein [Cricetulus griseus]|uniref:Membrane cofactor protein n=1 Tax=Cricetulus griseus TaxID=10029 RepID=A0A9J7FG17_CRIGR|nr:membrane cofactor protein [Cricetulus griseus]XP_027258061.1 membrane cofactor protein [Cricetulus griseus]ERE81651.1 membrane cofactor protein [Cricetulus griseus]